MMKIAGLMKASLIDYPGKASAVVFFGGCNFRCGYCHNPEIVDSNGQIEVEDFFMFLEKRKRFLDAVCISGGEPTLQPELVPFLRRIRDMGMAVKLDTNGSRPQVLSELLKEKLLDYVAMDVKAPCSRYCEVAGQGADGQAAARSRRLLWESGIDFEFRTTVCREQLSLADLQQIAAELEEIPQADSSVIRWYLQQFRRQGEILDRDGVYSSYSREEMEEMAEKLMEMIGRKGLVCVSVR